MTELQRSIEKIHWLFDENSHVSQVKGISIRGDDVFVELSDPSKNFIVSNMNKYEIADLLEQICQGIDKADGRMEI